MTTPTPSRRCLTPTEAAKALGISRSTCYVLIASGEVPSVRIGSSAGVHGLRRYVAKLAKKDGASPQQRPDLATAVDLSRGAAREHTRRPRRQWARLGAQPRVIVPLTHGLPGGVPTALASPLKGSLGAGHFPGLLSNISVGRGIPSGRQIPKQPRTTAGETTLGRPVASRGKAERAVVPHTPRKLVPVFSPPSGGSGWGACSSTRHRGAVLLEDYAREMA